MVDSERLALLGRYRETVLQINDWLAKPGESVHELRESKGEWRVREIVHHLADVEVGDAMRLRMMIAHDAPLIVAYDETLFAQRLHYERPLESSLAIFASLRASNAEIVERLEPSEWSREGRHEERDQYSVEILVHRSIEHDLAHLDQMQCAARGEGIAT